MRLMKRILCCTALVLSVSLALCSCGNRSGSADATTAPEFAPKTSAYGVTEMKYKSPLSSQAYLSEELTDNTKFRFEVGYTIFSATYGGHSENFVSPTYVILKTTDAFVSVSKSNAVGADDMSVYINIHESDTSMTASLAPDVTAFGSIAAYAVHDKDDNNTGYVIYVLDDEMWIGRFAAADQTSPQDYIVKTNI